MKKQIGLLLTICAVIFTLTTAFATTEKNVAAEAERFMQLPIADVYSSYAIHIDDLETLEEYAQLVVEAKVLPNRTNMPGRYNGYTRTEIEITKVFSGNVSIGDTLVIREPFVVLEMYNDITDPNAVKEETLMCYNGYRPAEVGETYLFFLDKSLQTDTDEEQYCFIMSHLSRYDIPNENVIRPASLNNNSTQSIHESIYTQVLNKYYK